MTLKEYIEQNGNKPIEIQDDGTIRILEEKGPWKPKNCDRYFHLYGNGDLEETYWFGWDSEDRRAELGNVFQTTEEAKRMVNRPKARKKFLDAGGLRVRLNRTRKAGSPAWLNPAMTSQLPNTHLNLGIPAQLLPSFQSGLNPKKTARKQSTA